LPPSQRDLTNLYISESYYRLMQTDPTDDITLLDGTGSLVTYLAISGTLDAYYLKGNASGLTNIPSTALPPGIVSSSTQTIGHLGGTNIVSSSGQRSVLGLGTSDSPIFHNVTLTGNLTAQQIIVSSSVYVVTQSFSSGSTIFGDSLNDTHQFTGSVYVSSSFETVGSGIFQGTKLNTETILRVKGFNTGSQLAIGVSGDGNYGIQNSVLNSDGTDYRRHTFTANGFYFNIVSGAFQQENALRINGDGTTRIHEIWTDNYVNAPGLENTDPNGFAELDWYYGGEFADVIARRTGVTIDTGDNDTTYTWKFDNSGSLYLPFTASNNIYNSDGTVWTSSYSTTAQYAENLIGTGSFATTGSNTFTGNQLIDGNVVIGGTLTAQTYVISSSIVNIQTMDVSGSTIFGDTPNDTHQFIGSVSVSNGLTSSMGFYGDLTGTSSWAYQSNTSSYIDPLYISASVAYYGFAGANDVQWNNILFKPANIISSSGQRSILGLGENDSPRFSTIYGTNANLDGNLLVGGTITARTYVISSSVVNYETINVSGSTVFGDTLDDTHRFTGSLYITGSVNSPSFIGNLTGTSSWASNAITASHALTASFAQNANFDTSSFARTGSNFFNGTQVITGSLIVTDRITAQEFYTEIVSSSVLYDSGSTKFGNTLDDTHQFTGSLYVTGALVIPTVQTLSPTADVGTIVINSNNLYIYF
jgi:hypothetical protein